MNLLKQTVKRARYLELLGKLFLFEGAPSEIAAFAMNDEDCECREYEPGEAVYTKTEFQRSIGVILTGELKAVKRGADGSTVLLNRFFPGGVFGVAALFSGNGEYVSEVLAVKCSRVLFLPQCLLQQIFRREPRVAENYIAYLSSRICFLNSRIDNYTGGSAESRLAGFLFSLAEDGQTLVEMPSTLTSLADMLNIGRASLYRAFDALEDCGAISRQGKQIHLLDPALLKSGRFTNV